MELEEATKLKQKGNESYEQHEFDAAFKSYARALQYDNTADSDSIQLRFDVLSNLLQTCIKMNKYGGQQHLKMIVFAAEHKNNIDKKKMSKALYRCGVFFEKVPDWKEASGAYLTALDYDSNNSEAQAALARANKLLMDQQDSCLQLLADSRYLKKGSAEVLSVTREQCVVCQEGLGPAERCLVLNCSHPFHQMCIVSWNAEQMKDHRKLSCPTCRAFPV